MFARDESWNWNGTNRVLLYLTERVCCRSFINIASCRGYALLLP